MTLRNAFADLATDDTLQEVLAKLPAAPATAGGQATGNAALAQIVTLLTTEGGYLDGVEALLAAIRDKLIAAPASEAKVEAVRALLAGTLAISAAALPLPAGAATDAKVEAVRALLASGIAVTAAALPLPAGAATDAKSEAIRALLAGTLAISAATLPLPAGAATSAKQDAAATTFASMLTALTGTLAVRQTATSFTDRSIASLTAGQAAGTTLVLDVNAARRVLAITPTADGRLYIASTASGGFFWPLYAGVTRVLSGADCPTNALYVTGQAAGTALPLAEG